MEDNFIVLNIGHAQTVHKWMNEDISSPFVRLFYVITFRTLLYALSSAQPSFPKLGGFSLSHVIFRLSKRIYENGFL